MQRHYVMYYEMSYGLNVEMHKQTEICKRLDAIIRQVLPFLSGEHQQQVALAVDRAKQITITELNAVMQQHQNGIRTSAPMGLPPTSNSVDEKPSISSMEDRLKHSASASPHHAPPGPPSLPTRSRTPTSSRSPSSASMGRPASAGAG